jgi:hypothetical protein
VILRYDRRGIEIASGDHDPAGAMAVPEIVQWLRKDAGLG